MTPIFYFHNVYEKSHWQSCLNQNWAVKNCPLFQSFKDIFSLIKITIPGFKYRSEERNSFFFSFILREEMAKQIRLRLLTNSTLAFLSSILEHLIRNTMWKLEWRMKTANAGEKAKFNQSVNPGRWYDICVY